MRGETANRLSRFLRLDISIRSPHARGDRPVLLRSWSDLHFNPLPSCEGRQSPSDTTITIKISIHSPHARGDHPSRQGFQKGQISIHSPHARGERIESGKPCIQHHLNPLPSCEGRRSAARRPWCSGRHFNPLPSCEGRRDNAVKEVRPSDFNPTPLMRGETSSAYNGRTLRDISIHSPHARGDHK